MLRVATSKVVSFAVLLWVALAGARIEASPASLAARLASDAPCDSEIAVSLVFEPLDGGEGRVSFGEERVLPPASVQKIVTSVAALDILGPDHTFRTDLFAERPIQRGHVDGSLYLHGDGDPFLVTERMWLLAHEAAAAGLRTVSGAIVVDAMAIGDLQAIRSGEEIDRTYAAPVSLLAMNFNCLTFLVRPAELIGAPAIVWIDPFPLPRTSVEPNVRTVAAGRATSLSATRIRSGETDVWRVDGTIRVDATPERIYRAAHEPALLAGGILAGLLGQHGIHVNAIRQGDVPPDAVVIVTLPSLPLGALIRSMNAHSNNFMADLLLVSLGDAQTGRSGSARVQEWIAERVPGGAGARIVDGSGLSAGNRISAGQVVRLLAWAHERERVFPDLYASLPRPGGEGTLKERFGGMDDPALRAKTGTLGDHGVSALAGYVDHPKGGRFAFCILQQAAPGCGIGIAELRRREEAWLREFASP